MTIAALLPSTDTTPTSAIGDRALVFVLNESFLDQFRTLCASLLATGSFLRCPVVVLTDETAVRDDPTVMSVADEVLLVGVDDTDFVKQVDTRRVPDKFRYKHLPKYTFTKWLIFRLQQYKELVYLDCDMICLTKLDTTPFFTAPMDDADMFGCPVFPANMYEVYKTSPAEYTAFFDDFLATDLSDNKSRLNSGVMRIGPRLLSGAFFDDMLAFASTKRCKNEQSYLTEFFRQSQDFSIAFWPSWYNMHAGNFGRLEASVQQNRLSKVAILHFIGDRKPNLTSDEPDTIPNAMWKHYAKTVRAKN